MNIRHCLVVVVAAAVSGGCATFELEGNGSITPAAVTQSETVHSSLYGFRWREFSTEKCETDSLFRVEFHTNAVFLLTSVLSLGLYVPQTVEWWCYTPSGSSDDEAGEEADEEVWVPPSAAPPSAHD